jgi:hypothetical protein
MKCAGQIRKRREIPVRVVRPLSCNATPPPCNDYHSKWPEMGYPAYVVRIHSLGGGASLAAAALGYAEGKVAAGGHSFLL